MVAIFSLRGLVTAVAISSTSVFAAPAPLEAGASLSERDETTTFPREVETNGFLVDRVTGDFVQARDANHTCHLPMAGDGGSTDLIARGHGHGHSSRCTSVLDIIGDVIDDADEMLEKLVRNVPRVVTGVMRTVRSELNSIIQPFDDAVRHYNKYGNLEGHGRDCHYLRKVDRYLPKVLDAMDQVQDLRSALPAQYKLYVDAAYELARQLKKYDSDFHRFVKHVCPSRH